MLCRHKPLLLGVAKHMTGCSILVWFNNFDRTISFYWRYMLLLKPPVLMHSCNRALMKRKVKYDTKIICFMWLLLWLMFCYISACLLVSFPDSANQLYLPMIEVIRAFNETPLTILTRTYASPFLPIRFSYKYGGGGAYIE